MDAIEAILNRRSIRKYSDKIISQDMIKLFLKAGFCAPSAGNQQPWHFMIIDNKELLLEIEKFHAHASMLKDADKAILVCGDLNLEKFVGYWMLDCSAATENILIAAHSQGVGACWLGIYPKEDRIIKTKKLLNLPENIIPLSLIALGYPGENKSPSDRFDDNRIHHNKW